MLVQTHQDNAGSRTLGDLLATREESQSRGVDVGDLFEIQNYLPAPGVDEFSHLLAEKRSVAPRHKLAAQTHDGYIVCEP